ncbi:ABC transporter ATP-binding protein [Clostridium sp. Marseille-Q2269]|uniref:ABC transporter ATP-binding protein n=1 Tax=Clostridium sp. Marseille-Q2269 TaxID=2942205 RepID=UPI0020732F9E|nr:ABC transporter ATP-binding protein [Clostridium sp. Marseille-Q2269]
MSFIRVKNGTKKFIVGNNEIYANKDINFEIDKGEFVIVLGASGAGKSTLLNVLGGMDTYDSGEVIVDGVDIIKLNKKEITTYRRHDIGFVFQFYNLVPNLTAKENIELSCEICPNSLDVNYVLKQVGLEHRKSNFPAQLSGGEQQRVAIARALAKNPKLLLCDEPTGALDYETGKQILRLLQDSCRKTGTTAIVITHNSAIAPMADKIIRINDGKVRSVELNSNPIPIKDISW